MTRGLPANLIGKMVYSMSSSSRMARPESSSHDAFELGIDVLPRQGDSWILALRARLAQAYGLGSSEKDGFLLDRIIGVRSAEPLLIGFPYTDLQDRRFVYWIALLVE